MMLITYRTKIKMTGNLNQVLQRFYRIYQVVYISQPLHKCSYIFPKFKAITKRIYIEVVSQVFQGLTEILYIQEIYQVLTEILYIQEFIL